MSESFKYRAGVEVWITGAVSGVLGLWMSKGAFSSLLSASFYQALAKGFSVAAVALVTVMAGIVLGVFFLYIAATILFLQKRCKGLLQGVMADKRYLVLTIEGRDVRLFTNDELNKLLLNKDLIGRRVLVLVGAFGCTMLFRTEP